MNFVIEFRSGSYFRGPRAVRGGSLGEAMRFDQRLHAIAYAQSRAPWVWLNGGMVVDVRTVRS